MVLVLAGRDVVAGLAVALRVEFALLVAGVADGGEASVACVAQYVVDLVGGDVGEGVGASVVSEGDGDGGGVGVAEEGGAEVFFLFVHGSVLA